jgi:AbrB family looped-hinge helix DNA binding protein
MKTEPTYRVKFSTRGRVTIPASLRKKYGLKAGSKMAFEMTPSGAIVLKPIVRQHRKSDTPSLLFPAV